MKGTGAPRLWRRVAADPRDWFGDDELSRSRDYNGVAARWQQLSSLAFIGAVLLAVVGRLGPRLDDALPGSWLVRGFVIGVVLLTLAQLASVPFEIAGARHRRRWGVDTRPVGRGVRAELGATLAVMVVGALVLLLLCALARETTVWWLLTGLVVGCLMVVVGGAYPLVIARSSRFEPLDDETLLRRLVVLSREAGVPVASVLVSRDQGSSSEAKAFFTGLGRARRIVVSDNVLDMDASAAEAILAHEISHVRRLHLSRSLVMKGGLAVLLFAGVQGGGAAPPVEEVAAVGGFDDPAAMPLMLLLIVAVFTMLQFVAAAHRRWQERRADLDALEITRDADAFALAVRQVAALNLSNLDPRTLTRLWSEVPTVCERLAIAEWWRSTRRVALLFTDVVGSTDLLERLGEKQWYELLAEHNHIVRNASLEHRGREVENPGDGFLFVFDDAGQALLAAIAMQRRLEQMQTPLPVRMGSHSGEVIRKDGNVFGREVHYAARIAGAAGGGEILVSDAVHAALCGTGRFRFSPRRVLTLKGFEGEHGAHPVDWHPPVPDASPGEVLELAERR